MKLLTIPAAALCLTLAACSAPKPSPVPQSAARTPAATETAAATAPQPTVAGTPATTAAVPAVAGLISPADAKARLDAGEAVVVVDVRTAEEYAEGHIPGSLLLPLDSIGADALSALPDKDAPLFVYCRSGRRSAIAAAQLLEMGYTQVWDLGGILSWPFEVTTE